MHDEMTTPPAPFVVGVGRSGTTLLRLMIDAHPLFAIPAETHFLPACAALHDSLSARAGACAEPEARQRFIALLTSFPTWPDFELSSEELKEAVDALPRFSVPDGVRAFFFAYARRAGKPRWGDKTPPYTSSMREIGRMLPEARFIHIIRDGRDVAVSLRPLWFAPSRDVRALATHWHDRIVEARTIARDLNHYLEVRYEELVASPETSLRTICAFLEIEYAASMSRYWERAASRLGEVRDRWDGDRLLITREQRLFNHRHTSHPPDPALAGRWRDALTTEEQQAFNDVAGTLLEELGYA